MTEYYALSQSNTVTHQWTRNKT